MANMNAPPLDPTVRISSHGLKAARGDEYVWNCESYEEGTDKEKHW
jgi:hypothetical protein